MRILVVGAGAVGGYFGGRLMQAGRDVTFLVRPRRADLLSRHGFSIRSPAGDFQQASPPAVTEDAIDGPFDLVILSCKAFDLEPAMTSLAKAVGPNTAILPLLNGMRHLDALADKFGENRVLGGVAIISSTLAEDGAILHLNQMHSLTFGELDGSPTPRIKAIEAQLRGAGFGARLSETIRMDMWEKWVFIATAAGITCLMRGAFGDIVAAGGSDLTLSLLAECAGIAGAEGFPPRAPYLDSARATVTTPGSTMTASMLRDIEGGLPVEADHILGDLLKRNPIPDDRSLLRIAYSHVKTYEARRARTAS